MIAVYRHLDLVKALDISDYAVGTAYTSFDRNEIPDGLNADDVLRVSTTRTPTAKKGRSRNATLYDDELTIALFEAAGRGDADEIRRLITEKGFSPETLLSTGITPLYHACATGNVSGVVTLLDLGADPNRRFSFQLSSDDSAASSLTALMYAANIEIIQIMIGRGADPNVASSEGYTPLMNTARRGDLDSVKTLLSAGANPLVTGRPFLSTEDVPPKTARQFAEAELRALMAMQNNPQAQMPQYAECVEKLERIVEVLIAAEQRVTKER